MRTKTIDSLTIEYPDEISFCFNPVIMNIKGDAYDKMIITITDKLSGVEFVESRDMFKLGCFFDLSFYMQSAFEPSEFKIDYTECSDGKIGRAFSVSIDMYLYSELKNSFQFDTFAIWGAMKIGERFNGNRTLKWFKSYPFTVSLYTATKGNIQVKADGVSKDDVASTGQNINNIPLNYQADKLELYLPGSTSSASVFDHTFDFTFRGLVNTATKVTCIADESESGVYLRWINRHGMYCYWLFLPGDETIQVSNDGEFIRNNMQDYNYVNGYHGGTGRKQRKTEENTIPICAPLVDSDTYDFLFSLTSSPVVDMYCGKDDNGIDCWKAVNVSVGSYLKSRKVLQDFEAVLLMPETNIQSL